MIIKTLKYLVIIVIITSCKKENAIDCFKSNGTQKTEIRYLADFNRIKTYDKIEVTIVKGTDYKIEVNAGKHLLSNIITKVTDGILSIQNKNKCNFVRGYKNKITATVTLPYLNLVENLGVGTVYFDANFNQDTLKVRAENSGDIYINGSYYRITTSSHGDGNIYANGTCNTLSVYMYGTNFFYGQNLTTTNYAFAENISIGSAYINAPNTGTFECNIHKDGNIYYTGNPTVLNDFSDGTAKGKLIKN